jgi:phosphohistidine swiveling domain-containing protein
MSEFPLRWSSPQDEEMPWLFDNTHFPYPVTPLSRSMLTYFMGGVRRVFGSLPQARVQNGYAYFFWEVRPPVVEPRRMLRLWNARWRPRLERDHERWKRTDPGQLSDDALVLHAEEAVRTYRDHWEIHFRVVGPPHLAARKLRGFVQHHLQVPEAESMTLIQGFGSLTTECNQQLWELSRQERPDLQPFLERFGWRLAGAPLEFATPSWIEEPSLVAAILEQLRAQSGPSPAALLRQQAGAREAMARDLRAQLKPRLRSRFDRFYADAAEVFPLSEGHAYYIDQTTVALLRRIFVACGRRLAERGFLADPQDFCYLELQEIVAALSGAAPAIPGLVERRKEERKRWSELEPPPRLGTWPPPAQQGGAPQSGAVPQPGGAPGAAEPEAPAVRGLGSSRGVARGRALVARNFREALALKPGEVLVCVMTDPTWTPLFTYAAAIVTESGSMMAHASVVAREYGLPAVVMARGATQAVRSGQLLEVDGQAGTVRVLGT